MPVKSRPAGPHRPHQAESGRRWGGEQEANEWHRAAHDGIVAAATVRTRLLQPLRLSPHSSPDEFPDPESALDLPNGLLAIGGDLRPRRLLCAYRRGIFPWFSDGQPILWWSPNPRAVLWPDSLRMNRSLRRALRRDAFAITADTAFDRVVQACAAPRRGQDGTWITLEMAQAYGHLHRAGHAHAIECWQGPDLVGGLYGVSIGRVFFGESMFSRVTDASKVAFAHLCTLGFGLIDCQIPNPHLGRLGAVEVERRRFLDLLDELCEADTPCLAPSDAARRGP